MVYADCIEDGDTEEEAKAKAEKKGNEFEKQMEEKAKEVAETAGYIDTVERELVREVGQDALKKIAEKKPLSAESKRKLATALSNASCKLKKAQIVVNLKSKANNPLDEPTREAQNTEFNKKINEYDNFRALLQNDNVSDVKKGAWIVTESFGEMMNDAVNLSHDEYMERMRSKLPPGMSSSMFLQQAREAYFVLNGLNLFGKNIKKCFTTLDDATGNIGSKALDKLGEIWDKLQIPSRVEKQMQDWGFSKRTALNTADLADYAAKSVATWGTGKCVGAMLSNFKKCVLNRTGAKRQSTRPSWPQSEKDDTLRLRAAGHKVDPHAYFKDGIRYESRVKGGIEVDNFIPELAAVEMKNYNLTSNVNGLINNIANQAIKHQPHLPAGIKQIFKIDARGQVCTPELENRIRSRVLEKTGSILEAKNIRFIKDRK